MLQRRQALAGVRQKRTQAAVAVRLVGAETEGRGDGQRCLDMGYLFVAVGADTGMLVRGSDALAAKFKRA